MFGCGCLHLFYQLLDEGPLMKIGITTKLITEEGSGYVSSKVKISMVHLFRGMWDDLKLNIQECQLWCAIIIGTHYSFKDHSQCNVNVIFSGRALVLSHNKFLMELCVDHELWELLKSKNLKIKKSTLERFLEECDAVAPWFAVSGSLTVPCWDKLGRDLDFAAEQGTLRAGVRPIWKMVRGCLEDQRCSEAIEHSKIALEQLQEERSEKTASEKGAAGGKSLYPNLEDFEFSEFPQTDSEGDGESEEELLAASVRSIRIRPTDHPKTRKQAPQCCAHKLCKQTVTPMAPPPYTQGSSNSFSPET
ncbi:hypothetical protein STEG23_017722 [Scotinomys teguina]